MYWLKRLDEIAQELAQAGEEKLAEDAEWTIDVMLGKIEERETKVLREFKAVEGFIWKRPVQWEE